MSEGILHIRDVEGPKKTGSVETRLEAMEQQVFKCQGMVERGLKANHMMITEFTSKHKMDAIDIGKHISTLYDRVDQLQCQIYDLQNQNCNGRVRRNNIDSFGHNCSNTQQASTAGQQQHKRRSGARHGRRAHGQGASGERNEELNGAPAGKTSGNGEDEG
ncbi:40S ribosomal protein S5-1 [Hordeum vulgare]|nr:40S ribosomal protein S5-1 [Hordeum vulgare]